jgi:hypothetical protein
MPEGPEIASMAVLDDINRPLFIFSVSFSFYLLSFRFRSPVRYVELVTFDVSTRVISILRDIYNKTGRGTLCWVGALCFPLWVSVSVSLCGVLGVCPSLHKQVFDS